MSQIYVFPPSGRARKERAAILQNFAFPFSIHDQASYAAFLSRKKLNWITGKRAHCSFCPDYVMGSNFSFVIIDILNKVFFCIFRKTRFSQDQLTATTVFQFYLFHLCIYIMTFRRLLINILSCEKMLQYFDSCDMLDL